MCRMASFVVTKNKVYWSKLTDSHEAIIREFNLNDWTTNGPTLARVEIAPDDNDYTKPIKSWEYHLDQNLLPTWYDPKEVERRCQKELVAWVKQKIVKSKRKTVYYGNYLVYGSGHVNAYDSSHVNAYNSSYVDAHDSSHVDAHDSSRVDACGSSHVDAYDSSHVDAYNSSHVNAYDSSYVDAHDSSHVDAHDSSRVDAYNSSHVKAYNSSHVELKAAKATYIRGNVLYHCGYTIRKEAVNENA